MGEGWGWQGWADTDELLRGKTAWNETCSAGSKMSVVNKVRLKSAQKLCPPSVESVTEPGATGTCP